MIKRIGTKSDACAGTARDPPFAASSVFTRSFEGSMRVRKLGLGSLIYGRRGQLGRCGWRKEEVCDSWKPFRIATLSLGSISCWLESA